VSLSLRSKTAIRTTAKRHFSDPSIATAALGATTKMQEPSFLKVLTATESAFQMENGVWVVPLGCLKNLKTNSIFGFIFYE